ncbi:MAG: response regulator [Candidatus Kapaibacterium sp.]
MRQKILIVDDKVQNLVALENVLHDCDAEVYKALSGNEALRAILTHDFALAILDVNMPEMNGYELAEFIAGDPKTMHLPMIFLSAEYSDDLHIVKAYESGGIDFVSKPFNPYYLLSKVNIFLKLDRQKHELLGKIEIEKSRNYLESILMSVNDIIFVVSLDGLITVVNNAVLTKLKYTFEEIQGEKAVKLFSDDIGEKIDNLLNDYKKSNDANNPQLLNIETYLKYNGDDTIPVILSVTPLISKNGKVQGAVIVATDITERKLFEEELRIAKERAEELSKIKTNFLANMSHELRTPMVGILGFSELLSNSVLEKEQKYFAEIINDSGTRLMETLNLILDISLVESEKIHLKITEFDVLKTVKDSIRLFEKIASKKDLFIKIKSFADKFFIKQDVGLFSQILNNLINNALKFTEKGGITIIIGKETILKTEYAVIKVQDTGIGIPDDKISVIWEEFRQVSEGYGRLFEGTGLGLSLSKKFIEKLGGEISVEESRVGYGSTIKVLLPVVLKGAEESKNVVKEIKSEEPKRENDNPKKLEILYVEDDKPSALLVKAFVKSECNVDVAATGEEAIEKVKIKNYDAIFMDINLGTGMNGVKTAQEIKTIEKYKNVPFIAITAFAMAGDKEEFEGKGFAGYLSKPFIKSDLLTIVKDLKMN